MGLQCSEKLAALQIACSVNFVWLCGRQLCTPATTCTRSNFKLKNCSVKHRISTHKNFVPFELWSAVYLCSAWREDRLPRYSYSSMSSLLADRQPRTSGSKCCLLAETETSAPLFSPSSCKLKGIAVFWSCYQFISNKRRLRNSPSIVFYHIWHRRNFP